MPFPLTKAQIFDFLLMHDYTDYITLQQVMGELMDAEMVIAKSMRNRTHISLTDEGHNTLDMFRKRLSNETVKQVDEFLSDNEMELRTIFGYNPSRDGFSYFIFMRLLLLFQISFRWFPSALNKDLSFRRFA